ncbi:GNAT family N-acetyltransferase [Paenibacillus antri]|uniref:GNAT family N-acetyltransferase n=1 Tax=Paenibacillus antri TaxID=2582848 RepID=A0A5R9G8U4_9BACL|nr:GNAT family N-acetyltransferase [Paenibacillus antri]TLS49808.1 GNAT family N-acetyltransferase [Paenibacillus antri]
MKIREANLQDVEGIAHVHLLSWRETYSGIISESYLSNLSIEQRKKNWIWTFNNLNINEFICVAEDLNGRIVGFSNSGKNRNTEYEHEGEIYAIYLLKEYQNKGIGRMLFDFSVRRLRSSGYKSMMLWVLKDNPTLGFYKSFGGTVMGEKMIKIGEQELSELAVGWNVI